MIYPTMVGSNVRTHFYGYIYRIGDTAAVVVCDYDGVGPLSDTTSPVTRNNCEPLALLHPASLTVALTTL